MTLLLLSVFEVDEVDGEVDKVAAVLIHWFNPVITNGINPAINPIINSFLRKVGYCD
jgi:hypothetical protein